MSQISISTPLIGREDELTRLSGVLEHARSGEARAVLVAGDAGVGKTRLLDEVTGRAATAGMTVLTGHCVDLGDVGLPYLPFTEVLGALAQDERFADALAAYPAVGRLLGGGAVGDSGGRLRLFEGIAGLLADLSDITPLLLVLEDLHWADQSSRDLLRFLLSRGSSSGRRVGRPRTGWPFSLRTGRMICTGGIRCVRCSPSWCGCPASSGWSCGRWPTARWPGWCGLYGRGHCRTTPCGGSSSGPRATRSMPRSCSPPRGAGTAGCPVGSPMCC